MTRMIVLFAAAIAVAGFAPQSSPLAAHSSDYRIEAIDPFVAGRGTGPVELRLVHRLSGKVVDVAKVVDSELEMPMNGTSPMLGRAQHAPVAGSSALRFVVTVPMEGEWLLSVTAKAAGDDAEIHGVVPIYVERTQAAGNRPTLRRQ
jgi:hypothetical protein